MGAPAPARRRRGHQGAHREGRQPRDGAGRRGRARLAARDLVDQAGVGHQLQADAGARPHSRGRRASCASASPVTTCSTSPSPGCSPSDAASPAASRSRCCSGWRRRRPRRCARRPAGCCSTPPSCTRRSSTPRSATWSAGSRRTRAATTSCPGSSSSTTPRSTSASATGSPPRSRTSTSSCPRRVAPRTACTPRLPRAPRDFENEPDTDPALAANREWARDILARSATSKLGVATIAAAAVPSEDALRTIISRSAEAGAIWGKVPGTDRGELLDRIGEVLSVFRGRLIEVMASETGKTIAEADVEVSEVIDFAHFYAARARELAAVDGAVFEPVGVTVVTPPWNFPVADPRRRRALGARSRQRRAVQARPSGAALRRRAGRGDLGGRRPARAGDTRRRVGPRPRPPADHRAGSRPRHPDRQLRDRRAVPFVAGRPAAARRDQRQERHRRDAERRPRPGRRRRREERVRQRRAEVLGRLARHPGRIGRHVGAVPPPARRRGDQPRRRVPAGSRPPRWARSSSPSRASSSAD